MAKIISTFKKYEKTSNVKLLDLLRAELNKIQASPALQEKILPSGEKNLTHGNIVELFFQLDFGALGWMELLTKPKKDLTPLINSFNTMRYEINTSYQSLFGDLSLDKHLEYTAIEKCLKILIDHKKTLLDYLSQVGSLFGYDNRVIQELEEYHFQIKLKNFIFYPEKEAKRKKITDTAEACMNILTDNAAIKSQIDALNNTQAKPSFEQILNLERKIISNEERLAALEQKLVEIKKTKPSNDIVVIHGTKTEKSFSETISKIQEMIYAKKQLTDMKTLLQYCKQMLKNSTVLIADVNDTFIRNRTIIDNHIQIKGSKDAKQAQAYLEELSTTIDTGIIQREDIQTHLTFENQTLEKNIKHQMTEHKLLGEKLINFAHNSGLSKEEKDLNQLLTTKSPHFETELSQFSKNTLLNLQNKIAQHNIDIENLNKKREKAQGVNDSKDAFTLFFTNTLPVAFGSTDEIQDLTKKIISINSQKAIYEDKISELKDLQHKTDQVISRRDELTNTVKSNNKKIDETKAEINQFNEIKSSILTYMQTIPTRAATIQENTKAQYDQKKRNSATPEELAALKILNEYIKNRCELPGNKSHPLITDFIKTYPAATKVSGIKNEDVAKVLRYIAKFPSVVNLLKQKISNIMHVASIAHASKQPASVEHQKEQYINAMKALYRLGDTKACNEIIGNPDLSADVHEKQKNPLGIRRDYSIEASFYNSIKTPDIIQTTLRPKH